MLEAGATARDFTLPDQEGNDVSLAELPGETVVEGIGAAVLFLGADDHPRPLIAMQDSEPGKQAVGLWTRAARNLVSLHAVEQVAGDDRVVRRRVHQLAEVDLAEVEARGKH